MAHEDAGPNLLAYVTGRPMEMNGEKTYVYVLGVNVKPCTVLDDDGNVVLDRTGVGATDLCNTLVHEFLYAYMDDYNRTGMAGAVSEETIVLDLTNMTQEQMQSFVATRYPLWFIEGTASAVENVYQYRQRVGL